MPWIPTVDNVRIFAYFVARMEVVSFLHLIRCFPAPDISDRVGFETDIFVFNFVDKCDFDENDDWYVSTIFTMLSEIDLLHALLESNVVESAFFFLPLVNCAFVLT